MLLDFLWPPEKRGRKKEKKKEKKKERKKEKKRKKKKKGREEEAVKKNLVLQEKKLKEEIQYSLSLFPSAFFAELSSNNF